MGNKDNFYKATYELFGIGNAEGENIVPEGSEYEEITRSTPAPLGRDAKSYIAPGTSFEGTLRTTGSIEIAGEFKGDIFAEGQVILRTNVKGNIKAADFELDGCEVTGDIDVANKISVGADAAINGNIYAKKLECFGKINGDIIAEEEVILNATAEVCGNLKTVALTMTRGAKIQGNIDMVQAQTQA